MLELKNIYFFKDNKQILTDVSLNIDNQKFVAVTGPNGSGKSTLAKIIMGLFKPDSGQILFGGQDITNLSITERAKLGIGFAFQQPVKFKGLTVKDLIEIAAGNSIKLAEACDYLSDVGLCAQEYLNREISASLSGGELKRIEIAMLAAKKSKLTIFDEPEAGIDLWSFNNLISVFEKMHQKINGSIIVISHQEKILNIADEIILLNNGKIIDKGPKENMLPKLLDKKKFLVVKQIIWEVFKMELNKLEKDLLSKIADIESTPIGAYNIRKNGKGIARNTTTNIDIITKTDKPGIDIIIKSKY